MYASTGRRSLYEWVGASFAALRPRIVPCICTVSVFGSVSFGYIDVLVLVKQKTELKRLTLLEASGRPFVIIIGIITCPIHHASQWRSFATSAAFGCRSRERTAVPLRRALWNGRATKGASWESGWFAVVRVATHGDVAGHQERRYDGHPDARRAVQQHVRLRGLQLEWVRVVRALVMSLLA